MTKIAKPHPIIPVNRVSDIISNLNKRPNTNNITNIKEAFLKNNRVMVNDG